MRSGKLGISRGHQRGQPSTPTPRLALVPRESVAEPKPKPKPTRARKGTRAPAPDPPVRQEPPPEPQPAPASPEYRFVHDRLTALERLATLRKLGIITLEEFAAEKALVLNPPTEELMLRETAPIVSAPVAMAPPRTTQPRGGYASVSAMAPPLANQMFSWRFLPVGVALGLILSYASQPRETVRFFSDLFSLIGV